MNGSGGVRGVVMLYIALYVLYRHDFQSPPPRNAHNNNNNSIIIDAYDTVTLYLVLETHIIMHFKPRMIVRTVMCRNRTSQTIR